MNNSYIYILTNKNNTVLYVGVTSNLNQRIEQHKNKTEKGFTAKYNCNKLVYFEEFTDIKQSIVREKQLKSGNRSKKITLIESQNPAWEEIEI